jgi:hypothetical protein
VGSGMASAEVGIHLVLVEGGLEGLRLVLGEMVKSLTINRVAGTYEGVDFEEGEWCMRGGIVREICGEREIESECEIKRAGRGESSRASASASIR